MKTTLACSILSVLCLATTVSAGTQQAKPTVFHAIDVHYQAIWIALADDHLKGVKQHAEAIAEASAALATDFDAQRAGVSGQNTELAQTAIPEIRDAAKRLATAETLETSRLAFYAMSKPLVRYRSAVAQPGNIVVYCSMAEKAWLQPNEAIGNPYYGKSMLRCGDVVSN